MSITESTRERRPPRVTGGEHDEFWAHCNDDELHVQQCAACSHYSWPPAPACEKCGGALAWRRLSGRGKVVSWCTFERRYYEELEVPWDTILVELEEGPLFISNPLGFTNDEITANMPVHVRFLDCEDAAGAYRLPVFERSA